MASLASTGGIEKVNGLPVAHLAVAAAHVAWARRFMPWLLKDGR